MYSIEFFNQGIEFLGITDPITIEAIELSMMENRAYIGACADVNERIRLYRERFTIPGGISKAETRKRITQCNAQINELREQSYLTPSIFIEAEIEDWVQFKQKLESRLVYAYNDGDMKDKIARAKATPMTNFLTFNAMGFAKCIWHDEKTGSMKYYPAQNKVHCFSCNKSADTIDVIQKLHGVTLAAAIKIITT